jgi:IclR family transcriptional regulator, KDG regulon repressor
MGEHGYSVTSVLRALDVLEYLAHRGGAGRVSDIAKELRCSKNTAFRLLKTLQHRGFVSQTDDASYELTFKLLNLGECVLRSSDLHAVARPHLEALNQQFGETVSLGILDGDEIVYLDRVLGTRPYHTSYSVGARTTAYSTALGKAILAFSAGTVVDRIIQAGLRPRTDNTITNPERLGADLRRTAMRGYAYDNQESVLGIRCIGAPVFDRKGDVVAAISVSALAARVTDEYARTLAASVVAEAGALSSRLGYAGPQVRALGVGQRHATTAGQMTE